MYKRYRIQLQPQQILVPEPPFFGNVMTPTAVTEEFPVVDIGRCILCLGCISIAPDIFFVDESTGKMSVANAAVYPKALVDEAIKNCPKDCIYWDQPL